MEEAPSAVVTENSPAVLNRASAERRRLAAGIAWSLASAILWSTTYIAGRSLMAERSVDPITLSMVRFAFGGTALLLVGTMLLGKRMWKIGLQDFADLAFLGAFGVAGMSSLFFFGQQTVTAITSSLLMQASPVMTYFLAVLVGERIRLRGIAGIAVSLAGCLLVIGVFSGGKPGAIGGDANGFLLVFLSALCWAIYAVAGMAVVARLGGFCASAWAMLLGAAELFVLWLLIPLAHTWPATTGTWAMVAYLAVFPTALGFLAWYQAMERIPLPLLNVMQYLTPVFTIILAWALLGERMAWSAGIGALLVLAGVALTTERPTGHR